MPSYIGRFAPSPTGLLHMGSLVAALASYLDAKAAKGFWLVRMENLDPPREMPGAAQLLLEALTAHGLQWDGDVLWQHQRLPAYTQAIEKLLQTGTAYYCTCTRADLRAMNGVYSGLCRKQTQQPAQDFAIRALLPNTTTEIYDAIQGPYQQQLQQETGDIIIQRKDKLHAYQLAVVVDDAYQGITHVVRGSDLLESTPRQIALQQLLELPTPHYAHIPIITNKQGQKLSKQTFADNVCENQTTHNLIRALTFLQQPLPPEHLHNNNQSILTWAVEHWQLQQIPSQLEVME